VTDVAATRGRWLGLIIENSLRGRRRLASPAVSVDWSLTYITEQVGQLLGADDTSMGGVADLLEQALSQGVADGSFLDQLVAASPGLTGVVVLQPTFVAPVVVATVHTAPPTSAPSSAPTVPLEWHEEYRAHIIVGAVLLVSLITVVITSYCVARYREDSLARHQGRVEAHKQKLETEAEAVARASPGKRGLRRAVPSSSQVATTRPQQITRKHTYIDSSPNKC